MERFVVAINEQVSNKIPDDLAFSILSKLPLKSLKRFLCIRKSWVSFCETPSFMSMFRKNFLLNNQSYYDDASLILQQTMTTDQDFVLYSVLGERFENSVKLDCPNLFRKNNPVFNIFGYGSINGIYCLSRDYELKESIVLWNPATEELKVIPSSPLESVPPPYISVVIDRVGFGYDCISDDYKVIRRVTYFLESESESESESVSEMESESESVSEMESESESLSELESQSKSVCTIDNLELEDISEDPFWEVYSLNNDSWKKIGGDHILNYEASGVYADGACHWWTKFALYVKTHLVSFDMRKEEFITTPMPLYEKNYFNNFVYVLSGYVALVSNNNWDTTFHISILGEIGVKESWVKLYTIRPQPYIMFPIGVGKKGIFFKKDNDKLAYLDLNTQTIVELGLIGNGSFSKVLSYKARLLPIGFSSWNKVVC